MNRKGWLTPLAVVIIFTIVLITYQQGHTTEILANSTSQTQLPWHKDVGDINRITFDTQQELIIANRQDSQWELTMPIQISADSSYIYSIISSFVSPGVVSTVTTNITDASAYGITDHSMSLTLHDYAGKEYTLICGKEADANHYYTYSPLTEDVYTIPKHLFDNISKDLSTWYDKDYIKFNAAETNQIVVSHDESSHVIIPKTTVTAAGEQVSYTSPTLSQEQISYVINFLKTSKISQFIVTPASDNLLETYGFYTPHLTLEITRSNGEVFKMIINTDNPTDTGFYVYIPGTQSIVKIPIFNMSIPPSATRRTATLDSIGITASPQ